MKPLRRILTLAALLPVGMLVPLAQVNAAQPACDGSGLGRNLPVVLVHGYNSSQHTWDKVGNRLDVKGSKLFRFDYSGAADRWVSDSRSGPALAAMIDCLAAESKQQGGRGKVAVIAHSMGGLATLCATQNSCAGKSVGDKLAVVVTLGTPYRGSFLRGNSALSSGQNLLLAGLSGTCQLNLGSNPLCKAFANMTTSEAARAFGLDSRQITSLPSKVPSGVSWRAIAGKVRLTTKLFFKTVALNDDVGDLIVGTDSAQLRSSADRAGGTHIVPCGDLNLGQLNNPLNVIDWPECTHMNETSNTEFLATARDAILLYLRDHQLNTPVVYDWNADSPQRGEVRCPRSPEVVGDVEHHLYTAGWTCEIAYKNVELAYYSNGEVPNVHCDGFQNGLVWCNNGDSLALGSDGEFSPGTHLRVVYDDGLSEPTT